MQRSLTIRYFAAARAAVGVDSEQYEVQGHERVGDIFDRLAQAHPALRSVLPRCSVLLDSIAAPTTRTIGAAATLDVLPPFAGG